MTTKFNSKILGVNLNPRIAEITIHRILVLLKLGRVLRTGRDSPAAKACQQERWPTGQNHKQSLIQWQFSQQWHAQCVTPKCQNWSERMTPASSHHRRYHEEPGKQKVQFLFVTTEQFFVYLFWHTGAVLGIRVFLILQELENNFPSISDNGEQRPPEMYLYRPVCTMSRVSISKIPSLGTFEPWDAEFSAESK